MQVQRIQNNTYNATPFKAELSLALIEGSKKRWQGIADQFEIMTKKYPNSKYEFVPNGTFSKGLDLYLDINGKMIYALIKLKPKMTKLMTKMSDTEIANKLQKLFELWVESRKIDEQSNKIAEKLFGHYHYKPDIYADNYASAVEKGLHNKANNELKKDDFFAKMIDSIEFPF